MLFCEVQGQGLRLTERNTVLALLLLISKESLQELTGEQVSRWYPDDDVVDDYYKGDLPDWLQDGALTGEDKLQFYEVTKNDVEDPACLL